MGRAFGLILVGILSVLLVTVALTACSPQTGINLGQVGQGGMGSQETAVADYIVIAGKITDPTTGEWLNNFTIIPYLNGEELSTPQNRAISRLGKYEPSGEGVHDGCFILKIPNRYELTEAHDFVDANNNIVDMQYVPGSLTEPSHLFIWLEEVRPGKIFRMNVPEKQIEYAIAVMPEDNADLAPKYHQHSTTLNSEGLVSTLDDENLNGENVTTDPVKETPTDETVKEISWTREYTAPENTNIWETWDLYVKDQVPGMDWNTYYREVLFRYPDVAQTNIFVKGQIYHLPIMLES